MEETDRKLLARIAELEKADRGGEVGSREGGRGLIDLGRSGRYRARLDDARS
jgi:hypothetical protein